MANYPINIFEREKSGHKLLIDTEKKILLNYSICIHRLALKLSEYSKISHCIIVVFNYCRGKNTDLV